VLGLDIDNFKIINDTFPEGHPGGDRILQEAAEFLKSSVRGKRYRRRLGGEELRLSLITPVLKIFTISFMTTRRVGRD